MSLNKDDFIFSEEFADTAAECFSDELDAETIAQVMATACDDSTKEAPPIDKLARLTLAGMAYGFSQASLIFIGIHNGVIEDIFKAIEKKYDSPSDNSLYYGKRYHKYKKEAQKCTK